MAVLSPGCPRRNGVTSAARAWAQLRSTGETGVAGRGIVVLGAVPRLAGTGTPFSVVIANLPPGCTTVPVPYRSVRYTVAPTRRTSERAS